MISGVASYHFLDLPSDAEGRGFLLWLPQVEERYRSAPASNSHLNTINISILLAIDNRKPIPASVKVRQREAKVRRKTRRTGHNVDKKKEVRSGRKQNDRLRDWDPLWSMRTR